jgi:S-(hydroxymethyl)glutathione dehydrogenase/alcohol dehydrogenase
MKAAVMHAVNAPIVVEDVDLAAPQGREVLIKTAAAGLCHSDLLFLRGEWGHPVPTILGHEVAGVVEAIGQDVDYLEPGDHIIGCAGGPCYKCRYCVVGRPILCESRHHDRGLGEEPRLSLGGAPVHQYGQLSAFAEYMLVHENATVKISPDMPLDIAAIVGCAVATGLGAVFNTAQVTPGAAVVVTGCGGVGLNCVQGSRIAGASVIVAVDIVPSKLERALALGATHVVNPAQDDLVPAVLGITAGGADYVLEAAGNNTLAQQGIEMLGPGGVLTLVGLPPQGTKIVFEPATFTPAEKSIRGCSVGSLRPRVDIPRYIQMYMRGRLDLDPLVSARISLDAINAGFEAMERGEVARSVIVFD